MRTEEEFKRRVPKEEGENRAKRNKKERVNNFSAILIIKAILHTSGLLTAY